MDNLIVKKIWSDEDFLEINIIAQNEYIRIQQNCYVNKNSILDFCQKAYDYSQQKLHHFYMEFGHKSGNYTPAFSIELLPWNTFGHVVMELDMEINDNEERKHRCQFYISTEFVLLERFSQSLKQLSSSDIGTEFFLTMD